ncbi:hypothetical protein FE783_29775 [Paenibacillus mesophilus]|uniref:hypothetical protein n=1 Tax=Paenibacillus mesophilus TaxID=2582849 RepID=UPI00110DAB7F|nr:hypothetical protein [Paenibacillus mesophilus]TMV45285.1 hypothetical protein FE783_29775 [Paenibacillus mesophilus]
MITPQELRFVMNSRVPDIIPDQAEELLWIRERYDISYSAIAAGLFKCLPDQAALDKQMERMEEAIKLARKLGARTVTVLYRDQAVERLTVETHIQPYIAKTEKGVARLRRF